MDIQLLYWINSHHYALLDYLLEGASAVSDVYLIWFVLGLVVWVADKKSGRQLAVCIFLALAITYISVDLVVKPIVARPRPFAALPGIKQHEVSMTGKMVPSPFSFPSGHCASSMAAAWLLGRCYRRFRLPLIFFVSLIAYSRVYLGMHYPSDCVAGLAMGLLCSLLARRLCSVLNRGIPDRG